MISRRSARMVAEAYSSYFYHTSYSSFGRRQEVYVNGESLYDFLFVHDYPAPLCNLMKKQFKPRDLKEFIMTLHTGEAIATVTPDWTWEQREAEGREYLRRLAEDILNFWYSPASDSRKSNLEIRIKVLRGLLELDGFEYHNSRLLATERDVLDTREESGVLEALYVSLNLQNKDMTLNHLNKSEEHYINDNWGGFYCEFAPFSRISVERQRERV